MRLFQDAAGTTPAIAPGQPVGKVARAAGSVDATQATALSRPTLARLPKGGRRNMLASNMAFDPVGGAVVTAQAGRPSMFRIVFPMGGVASRVATKPAGVRPAGERLTGSVLIDVTGGAPSGLEFSMGVSGSFRAYLQFNASPPGEPLTLGVVSTSPAYYSDPVAFAEHVEGNLWRVVLSATVLQTTHPTVLHLWRQSSSSTTIEITAGGFQIEQGDVASPLQVVVSALDITEPGVPDVWHLYNDGGDSLLAPLPTGAHQIATVTPMGKVDYTTLTGDGTGKNILFGERVADIFAKAGTLSDADRLRLEEYWQQRYGAGYLIPPGMVPAARGMWQEVDGITAVTIAGQPVGRIDAIVPGVNAIQATALSRSTVARWPKGGRRNLILSSDDISASPWSGTISGASTRVVESGSRPFPVCLVTATSALGGAGNRCEGEWANLPCCPASSRHHRTLCSCAWKTAWRLGELTRYARLLRRPEHIAACAVLRASALLSISTDVSGHLSFRQR